MVLQNHISICSEQNRQCNKRGELVINLTELMQLKLHERWNRVYRDDVLVLSRRFTVQWCAFSGLTVN